MVEPHCQVWLCCSGLHQCLYQNSQQPPTSHILLIFSIAQSSLLRTSFVCFGFTLNSSSSSFIFFFHIEDNHISHFSSVWPACIDLFTVLSQNSHLSFQALNPPTCLIHSELLITYSSKVKQSKFF